ncbi:MAG: hypothetical protein CSB44_01565 [Gammaproteobacteria bacterium]|nr:MAG: hypothetical protein CSB44_01565 [Gammaproteobacteria bacterium]
MNAYERWGCSAISAGTPHDHWSSYFSFDEQLNVLCNNHHLRELIAAHENHEQQWDRTSSTTLTSNALIPSDIRADIEGGACYNETFVGVRPA